MRYFKFGFLLILAAFTLARPVRAQPPETTASPGVPSDFAASANARANYYRAMAKLPPIVEEPAISAGALNHARYLVKNGIAGGDIVLGQPNIHFQMPQDAFRWEVKGKPYYTDNGASAGRDAVIVAAPQINLSGAEFVDRLMTMPFSGLIPMVPQFSIVGLGAYCDPGQCAIVIPGRYALAKPIRIALYDGPASDRMWNPNLGLIPMEKGRLRTPVEFPPDGATVNLQSFAGEDYPDPLSCMSRLQSSDRRSHLASTRRRLRTRRQPRSVVGRRHSRRRRTRHLPDHCQVIRRPQHRADRVWQSATRTIRRSSNPPARTPGSRHLQSRPERIRPALPMELHSSRPAIAPAPPAPAAPKSPAKPMTW